MLNGQAVSIQRDLLSCPCIGVIALIAVDWTACVFKLYTDLVMPSAMQTYVHQAKPIFSCNASIIQACLFCAGRSFGNDCCRIAVLVSYEIVLQISIVPWISCDNCGVLFFRRPLFEALRQPCRRLACPCEYDNAANRTVETMNKPKKNIPGFVVFILYVFLGKREKVDIPR